MNDTTTELNEITSEEQFDELKKIGINVFLLTAPWCRPGHLVEKELEKIADKYSEKIKVFKINVDEVKNIPIKFNIFTFPTTIIFKKDAMEDEFAGYLTESIISNKIDILF